MNKSKFYNMVFEYFFFKFTCFYKVSINFAFKRCSKYVDIEKFQLYFFTISIFSLYSLFENKNSKLLSYADYLLSFSVVSFILYTNIISNSLSEKKF